MRGGVATLGEGVGAVAAAATEFRGVALLVNGFLPLEGCLLAGALLDSCIAMVLKFLNNTVRRIVARNNMSLWKGRHVAVLSK